MENLPVPKGEGSAWVRRFDAPTPSSKIHVWSTPPVLEIFPLLPTAYRVGTYIAEERKNNREPIV